VLQNTHHTQTVTTDESLADPHERAEAARQEGRNIVRSHLRNHVVHNTGRSSDYVSWIATLHPENADVTIDRRFLIPGNPWWTIYESEKTRLPSATAVEVTVDHHNEHGEGAGSNQSYQPKLPHPLLQCSPVVVFVGIFVWSFAVFGVVLAEALSLIPYIFSMVLYNLARPCNPPGPATAFFYNLLMAFYQVSAAIDSMALLISVAAGEITAATGWFFVVCFGGVWTANYQHQCIRVTCHAIRSISRSHCKYPERSFFLCCGSEPNGDDDDRHAEPSEVIQDAEMGGTSAPKGTRYHEPSPQNNSYEYVANENTHNQHHHQQNFDQGHQQQRYTIDDEAVAVIPEAEVVIENVHGSHTPVTPMTHHQHDSPRKY